MLLRLVAALVAGPLLSIVFTFLLCESSNRACNALFDFANHILQLGFEGAFATVVITVLAIAALFSIASWFVLRSRGPWRHESDPEIG